MKSFTCTSDSSYDRHDYKLVFSDGSHTIYECWQDVQAEWFQRLPTSLSHVEVLDKKTKPINKPSGFK